MGSLNDDFRVTFRPINGIFRQRGGTGFVMTNFAILRHVLSVMSRKAKRYILRLRLSVPSNKMNLHFHCLLLRNIQRFMSRRRPRVLIMIMLRRVRQSFIMTIVLTMTTNGMRFCLFLLLRRPSRPIMCFTTRNGFIIQRGGTSVVHRGRQIQLAVNIRFRQSRNDIP